MFTTLTVRSVVWSPDGQQLVCASDDKTVKFWDSSNGDQSGHLCVGHTDRIRSLAISSDGSFITTASADQTVRLWSTKTRRQIGQPLRHLTKHGKARLWFIKTLLEQHNAKEKMREDEEARQQHLICPNNTELPVREDIRGNQPSETHEVPGRDDTHSLFDILTKNPPVRNACIAGDLHIAEYLLSQEINADDNHNSYANRSVVRARNSQRDDALQDAVKVRRSAYHDTAKPN
ncbi:WD40-repeat-containing domain protein [Suillus lakei]|nr:WD40-repeat-containing domain protein [Suillus lakei]